MVTIRRLGFAIAVALVAPAHVAAQNATPQHADAQTWLDAVGAHEAGIADDPLTTVAPWTQDRLLAILRQALPAANTDTLARALSLHMDLAIVERSALERQAPGFESATVVVDGRHTGATRRSFHWGLGARIAAALAARPDGRAKAAEWFRTTGALLQSWGDLYLVEGHLEVAQKALEDDAVLAMYRGTLHQMYADPRVQIFRQRRIDATRNNYQGEDTSLTRGRVGSQMIRPRRVEAPGLPAGKKGELEAAEGALRRALVLDPGLHEARIRLAHVLSELGSDAQAVTVVRPALDTPLDPFLEFYAAMVLGRSAEHLGRYEAAGAAYARAAARFPGAQSAEVGRSRVALALGRPADALTGVLDVIGPGKTERVDPWQTCLRWHDPDAARQLQAWRGGLR